MRIILLCGGEGRRLWPLSRLGRTKPFIPLFEGSAGKQSTIQRIWEQLEKNGLSSFTHIVLQSNQLPLLFEQLGPSVPYLVEPEGKGTYPAVVYATACLRSKQLVSTDETIIVIPADLYVEDAFVQMLKLLEPALSESQSQLALIGVRPNRISDQYGYILPEPAASEAARGYRSVNSFREKPTLRAASELIEKGAYWNSGVAAFPLNVLINKVEESGLKLEYEPINARFHEFAPNSLDCELLEKMRQALVLPYEGIWRDMGGWEEMVEVWGASSIEGNMADGASRHNRLINETVIPVKIIGVDDLLVVVSQEGILIKPYNQRYNDHADHENPDLAVDQMQWRLSPLHGY